MALPPKLPPRPLPPKPRGEPTPSSKEAFKPPSSASKQSVPTLEPPVGKEVSDVLGEYLSGLPDNPIPSQVTRDEFRALENRVSLVEQAINLRSLEKQIRGLQLALVESNRELREELKVIAAQGNETRAALSKLEEHRAARVLNQRDADMTLIRSYEALIRMSGRKRILTGLALFILVALASHTGALVHSILGWLGHAVIGP